MQQGGRRRQAPGGGAATRPTGDSAAGSSSGASGSGGQPVDKEWLKDQLVRILQWDPFVVEGVVEGVAGAGGWAEVEGIVEGFMGGSVPAKQVVQRYWQSAGAGGGSSRVQLAAPAGAQAYQKHEGVARVAQAPQQAPSRGGGGQGSRGGGSSSSRGGAPKGVELPPPTSPVAAKDGSKVLDLGINIRTTVKKGKGGGAGAGARGGLAGRLERPVVNCLSCGRIFDCRSVTNDTIQFLESGGICTFCGNQVALRYADGSVVEPAVPAAAAAATAAEGGTADQHPQSAQQQAAGAAGSNGGGATASASSQQKQAAQPKQLSESEAAALELKNRLVEYDRNSAKRTTVIDDQSDFFEIDSNAWLNEEERVLLKEQQRLVAEAEEARRKRVTVTFDLLGRRVLMANEAELASAEPAAAAAAKAAVEAAKATAEEAPQGGGTAAQAALERAEETLRSLRISVNPSMAAANYVFLPSAAESGCAGTGRGTPQAGGQGGPAAADASRSRDAPTTGGPGKAAGQRPRQRESRAPGAPARLQHDDPFQLDLASAVEVLADDEESRMKMEQSMDEAERGPFDLCPPMAAAAMQPLAPLAGRDAGGAAAGSSQAAPRVEVVQPGMVLLRGWLGLEQQAEIVSAIRVLGLGAGGFYTPSYSSGGQLSLRMMSLGYHWEPRTASYEPVRSSHDGATPPPIPPSLLGLVQRCMAEAQAAPGVGALPPIKPDVCLCNFYEPKQGRLGLHQDKDEGAESLRAGIPVVSFSLGDAADFVFGPSRDEARCRTLRLESGDALVFGGPARMLYHGVAKVHGGSAPAQLLARTNLRPGRLNLTFRQR